MPAESDVSLALPAAAPPRDDKAAAIARLAAELAAELADYKARVAALTEALADSRRVLDAARRVAADAVALSATWRDAAAKAGEMHAAVAEALRRALG